MQIKLFAKIWCPNTGITFVFLVNALQTPGIQSSFGIHKKDGYANSLAIKLARDRLPTRHRDLPF